MADNSLKKIFRIVATLVAVFGMIAACAPTPEPSVFETPRTIESTHSAQTEEALLALAVLTVEARITQTVTPLDQTTTPISPSETPPALVTSSTPIPTETPIPAFCDRAELEANLSSGSQSYYTPGALFLQTWRLRNIGDCTWSPNYSLVPVNSGLLSASPVAMNGYIRPGQSVDLTVQIIAPQVSGFYTGYFYLQNPAGEQFGVGANGEQPIPIQITVGDYSGSNIYDLAELYCNAQWQTGAGSLNCASSGDLNQGAVTWMDNPIMENGLVNQAALWTLPNNNPVSWITGLYPSYLVQLGDRFKTQVGCLVESYLCDVLFKLEVQGEDGSVSTLGEWRETYDGRITSINLDLSPLIGQHIRVILSVTVQNNQPEDANAVWIDPRIER